MKFYLSSLKLGNKKDELKKWIKDHDNKICLIPNARDVYPDGEKKTSKIYSDLQELTDLGFEVTILSLKEYFNKKDELLEKLKEFHAFYVIGGNTLARGLTLDGLTSSYFSNDLQYESHHVLFCFSNLHRLFFDVKRYPVIDHFQFYQSNDQ